MNSPYIAIDIETTGTDTERHQVLEIAAVYNQLGPGVMSCPHFQAIVDPGEIVGEPRALVMNARLLERIANGEGDPPGTVMAKLMDWVYIAHRKFSVDRFHLIGKNIGKFDYHFLKRMPGWEEDLFSHRHMEIGSIYSTPEGISGQSDLHAAVAADAKIEGAPHEALYDARVSLELARRFWQSTLWKEMYGTDEACRETIEKSEETA